MLQKVMHFLFSQVELSNLLNSAEQLIVRVWITQRKIQIK